MSEPPEDERHSDDDCVTNMRSRRDRGNANTYEKSRVVEFSFSIPFGGEPADTCEEMIREHITRSLLNSLSEIHPDIRCSIYTSHQQAIRRSSLTR